MPVTELRDKNEPYDVIIIGGGPAGLTAGIYCARARLDTLLLEEAVPGGQISTTTEVENFPGFPDGILGPELGERMLAQAQRFGLTIAHKKANRLTNGEALKQIHLKNSELTARAVIIASGSSPRKLNIPGEEELSGHGVSYCATCDGPFFRDKNIAVVGGGSAAVEEASFLTRFAKQVTIIHRRNELRADKILQEMAFANKKMSFLWDNVVEAIKGDTTVNGLVVRNVKTNERREVPFDGLFVMIGQIPNTGFLENLVELDERGYVVINDRHETSVPGIFAGGDVHDYYYRQAITAAGDGAAAAISAAKYLAELLDK